MSHLAAVLAALAAGVAVGAGAGLFACRVTGRAVEGGNSTIADSNHPAKPRAYLLVGLGVAAGLLVGIKFGVSPPLPAYLYLVAIAPALGSIDAATRRLPNSIVLPSYPIATALLGFAAWQDGDPAAFWRSLLAGAAVYAFLLLTALAAPSRSFGWGDVKLGGVLGMFLGYQGWLTTWIGVMSAFMLAAAYIIIRSLVTRGPRPGVLPLGPALLLGTLLAVVAKAPQLW